jgi:hypothetical protein
MYLDEKPGVCLSAAAALLLLLLLPPDHLHVRAALQP